MSRTPVLVVDSHTEGEPTRLIRLGLPELGEGSFAERAARLGTETGFMRSVVLEPRGHSAVVGAALLAPDPGEADLGVVFFNNVGLLGMCGHGTIGVVATLAWLGELGLGEVRIQTPAGTVRATLEADGRVAVRNVRSSRSLRNAAVDVLGETLVGDVAWGGNGFFLAPSPIPLAYPNVPELTRYAQAVRAAIDDADLAAEAGHPIDHIELTGPPGDPSNHGRNFVLCPGLEWDRSPCGTGTSAKVACLAAEGRLKPGEGWRQEGILGGVFEADFVWDGEEVLPTLRGRAFVTAEATLYFDPADPFREGIG